MRQKVGVVVATALTEPQTVGLACACWTLAAGRWSVELAAPQGRTLKRRRLDALLRAAGVR
jgi:hypothetical protein